MPLDQASSGFASVSVGCSARSINMSECVFWSAILLLPGSCDGDCVASAAACSTMIASSPSSSSTRRGIPRPILAGDCAGDGTLCFSIVTSSSTSDTDRNLLLNIMDSYCDASSPCGASRSSDDDDDDDDMIGKVPSTISTGKRNRVIISRQEE
jgi:hypothetical protein